MDDKLYMVLVLGVIFVVIVTVKGIKNRYSAKIRQKYYSDYMWHFNKANAEHQKLCNAARYYIENDYVCDIRLSLQEYNQKVSDCLWQADKFAKLCLQYSQREMWENLLKQAYMQLDFLEAEQKKFSQTLNYCEQEEQKYKKAFAKYGSKSDVKDSYDISSGLFNGCTDYESLHKRYKDLMKVYHSDIQNGDNEMATKINAEYEKLKKKYSM